MSTFAQELRQHVIEPTVWQMGLGAPGVINLLVGTALTESGLKSLKQRRGPALGLWQMEPDYPRGHLGELFGLS